MNHPEVRKQPYALKTGEGWVYRFGIDFVVKSSEIQKGSGVAIVEYSTQQGEEQSFHTHLTEDEMFYVMEGSITFHCGGKTFDLEAGGFVFLPHGIQHGYTLRSPEPVRLLAITSPTRNDAIGGWKGFVADMEMGQGDLISKPPFME